ncbi:MAG TPA: 2Fe-2S iron-sulfur cluster binding domain-containing protein [Streptosporangiaceae bacterium]
MLLTYQGRGYELQAGESVLDGLARHGVTLPAACRAGVCHSCLLRAESGDPGEGGRDLLKATLAASGYFLACLAHPVTDMTVAPAADDMITPAVLLRRRWLAAGVLAVWLRPARPVPFRAGQHLTLSRDGGVARTYSLANLPAEAARHGMEFHLRVYPGGAMSGWLASARPGAAIGLGIPNGECFYLPGRPTGPLLLAGTGTGVGPLAAIARDALRQGHTGPVVMVAGAAAASRVYWRCDPLNGRSGGPGIRWRTCLLSRGEDIAEVVTSEYARLAGSPAARAYLCGGAGSVARARRALFLAGMSLRSIQADAFLPMAPAS